MAVRANKEKLKTATEAHEKNGRKYSDNPLPEITAAKRAKMPDFIEACSKLGIQPTKRQAAKYNAKANRWSVNHARILN